MIAGRLTQRQRGDFQTPESLATKIWGTINVSQYDVIVEPTFGQGSFLTTLPAGTRAQVVGWEIDPDYFRQTMTRLETHPQFGLMNLGLGDVFRVNRRDLFLDNNASVLVIGNPPWVTNSEQSTLGGQNTGTKRNLKSLTGLAAKTGKANFDISEAIILHLVDILKNAQNAQFALLGKFTVIRNLIQFLRSDPRVGEFEFHRINALKDFGASVDAGLIKFRVGHNVKRGELCKVFDDVGGNLQSTVGIVDGRFVYDLRSYSTNGFLERNERATYVWRQGIKHDLRDILELREMNGLLINRLGEKVEIENAALYNYYKSSDIFHGRRPRYVIPIYQYDLKDTLEDLPVRYPLLYSYLERHKDAFSNRKSSIYRNKNPFVVFGIGEYTHAPFKIAVAGFYSEPVFRLLTPDVYPSTVDDTSYAISVTNYLEANYIHAILNLDCVKEFLCSISYPGDKRRFSKDVLDRVFIPAFADVPDTVLDRLSDQRVLTDWLISYPREKGLF